MPTTRFALADHYRFSLARVAARLARRDGEAARRLAARITADLTAIPATAEALGAKYGDGHRFEVCGRLMRATPALTAHVLATLQILELAGDIMQELESTPALADLRPLLDIPASLPPGPPPRPSSGPDRKRPPHPQ